MTPTMEQIREWMTDAGIRHLSEPFERFAALAFAAGAQSIANKSAEYSTPSTAGGRDDLRDLLRRCRGYVQHDADMMADITRHAPLDPASQATHDANEYESEKLLSLIDAALAGAASRPVPTTDSTGADVLTEEEVADLLGTFVVVDGQRVTIDHPSTDTVQAVQAAARIGAERERESKATLLDELYGVLASMSLHCEDLRYAGEAQRLRDKLGAAIRRGEGG